MIRSFAFVSIALLGVSATWSHSQQQVPPVDLPTPPLAEKTKNGEILLTVGHSVRIDVPEVSREMDFLVTNEQRAQVRPDRHDPRIFWITGRNVGTTDLIITPKGKPATTYTIIVEPERDQLAKRVLPGFIAFPIATPKENNNLMAMLGFNDHVVVFFTDFNDVAKKTTVLMKNVRVIGILEDSVALEVTVEEAKRLQTAMASGIIAFGLISAKNLKDEKASSDRIGDSNAAK